MPGEQAMVVCLVGVELLLEADLEAGLEQLSLHLGWFKLLRCVLRRACRLHLQLAHVFLGCDHLVVHCRRAGLVIWIGKGSGPFLFEDFQSLVLSDRL